MTDFTSQREPRRRRWPSAWRLMSRGRVTAAQTMLPIPLERDDVRERCGLRGAWLRQLIQRADAGESCGVVENPDAAHAVHTHAPQRCARLVVGRAADHEPGTHDLVHADGGQIEVFGQTFDDVAIRDEAEWPLLMRALVDHDPLARLRRPSSPLSLQAAPEASQQSAVVSIGLARRSARFQAAALRRRCGSIGNERMRWPVAANSALHKAGRTGGSAGSPRPVGGLSLRTKCTSTGGASSMRSSR